MAEIVELTSAAPFPRARRVTPANRGGRPSVVENCSRLGEKKESAVDPNDVKRTVRMTKHDETARNIPREEEEEEEPKEQYARVEG